VLNAEVALLELGELAIAKTKHNFNY